jgi:outer membrane immunogenic protein
MKILFLGAIAAIAVGAPAMADMPRPAPYVPASTWTGCYIGGNNGWAQVNHSYDGLKGVAQPLPEGGHTTDGYVLGGQIGCDYQFASKWVIGNQGMSDWANSSGVHPSTAFPTHLFNSETRWFGTVTGRLGYTLAPFPSRLWKGGLGMGRRPQWSTLDQFC